MAGNETGLFSRESDNVYTHWRLPMEFTIKEEHIKLLARINTGWCDYAYDGAPGVDPKRPFGNSNVLGDIFEIIHDGKDIYDVLGDDEADDWYDEEHPELDLLFREMEAVVQIVLHMTGKGVAVKAGDKFRRPQQYSHYLWEQVPA